MFTGAITDLATTPDDASRVDDLLARIVQLAVTMIGPAQYASVTAERDGAPTTVAMTNELALEVDEAQYNEAAGPCLDALDSGVPLSVGDKPCSLTMTPTPGPPPPMTLTRAELNSSVR
jgi:hypothetical protein